MVDEIRIYVEGGGEGKESKALIRQGLSEFLQELVLKVRRKRIRWQIIACGPRTAAVDNFRTALRSHPDAFNVLLVDSEDPVNDPPRKHLEDSDHWSLPEIDDKHYHLMVQTMEAWLIADIDALTIFYGQGFNANPIPGNPNVELVDKNQLLLSLKDATRNTSKGEYHKIRHGPKLLGMLDAPKVVRASAHCRRLFTVLTNATT